MTSCSAQPAASKTFRAPLGATLGVALAWAASAGLVACGSNDPDTGSEVQSATRSPISARKIIGNNDLMPVDGSGANVPPQFREVLDAIGRISTKCTATHIGHGLVLTAGHCFRANSMREGNIACDNIKVEWGARKGVAPYLVSTCQVVLAQETSATADYAIFTVDEAPRAFARIARAPTEIGRAVSIFGHPLQRPLEWSGICELLDPVQGGFDRADFAHQCDTEDGNSGSTVLDAATAEIVGIHSGGTVPYNYGTAILRTPITEFERYYTGAEPPPTLPDDPDAISFGKMDLENDQNDKLLVELAQEGKSSVSFKLTVNLEGQYDAVTLEDAEGRRSSRITGKNTFEMSGMKAPVKVLFSSDSSGLSNLVKISRISYR